MSWHIVIPVKLLAEGKSRLELPARSEFARAFALDTIAAAGRAASVAAVHVVSDETGLVEEASAAEPGAPVLRVAGAPAGLNPAIMFGVQRVRAAFPEASVAVLLGDLPALRPSELDAALGAAERHPLAFVRDADGEGTSLITARAGYRLEAAFGRDSAAAHARLGHAEIDGDLATLRRDVDTAEALGEALHLGVTTHTARLVRDGAHRASDERKAV